MGRSLHKNWVAAFKCIVLMALKCMIQGHTNSRSLNDDLHALLNSVTESKFWVSSCISWFTFQYIRNKLLCGTPLVVNPTCRWAKTHSPLKGQADSSIHFTVLFQHPLGLGLGLGLAAVPSHRLHSEQGRHRGRRAQPENPPTSLVSHSDGFRV